MNKFNVPVDAGVLVLYHQVIQARENANGNHRGENGRPKGELSENERALERLVVSLLPEPKPREIYKHANGNLYGVLAITNKGDRQDEYPKTVVYFDLKSLDVYSKDLLGFYAKRELTSGQVSDFWILTKSIFSLPE
jgi:hypothetical protein